MINKGNQKHNAKAFLEFLIDNKYFGDADFKFENGNIVHIKLTKGIKIDSINPSELYKIFLEKKKEEMHGFPIKSIIEKG